MHHNDVVVDVIDVLEEPTFQSEVLTALSNYLLTIDTEEESLKLNKSRTIMAQAWDGSVIKIELLVLICNSKESETACACDVQLLASRWFFSIADNTIMTLSQLKIQKNRNHSILIHASKEVFIIAFMVLFLVVEYCPEDHIGRKVYAFYCNPHPSDDHGQCLT